jgi:threonyl-tRNA synthetase
MKIILPDNSFKELPEGSTALDAAKSISLGLAQKAICAKVDGELFDLNEVLPEECKFEIVTKDSPDALHVLRHSAAHLMAQAIQHLYPGVQFAYGPATEDGFYYDMKLPTTISVEDFPAIEKEMQKIVKENLHINVSRYSIVMISIESLMTGFVYLMLMNFLMMKWMMRKTLTKILLIQNNLV